MHTKCICKIQVKLSHYSQLVRKNVLKKNNPYATDNPYRQSDGPYINQNPYSASPYQQNTFTQNSYYPNRTQSDGFQQPQDQFNCMTDPAAGDFSDNSMSVRKITVTRKKSFVGCAISI